ncbi:hypothetical protein E6P09_10445 [Haloferax mediterranei ATCC 33500]|uniref:Uncharacterized protein n=1 Tax=Haloferax mediterranei (strain ATCC 33500 / DSM 1411 / JCM 8866 / NBRC 14739 / NCIMB 2177 / R-4) TaxID=523841 RepID=I3R4N2_HALMT|nr:hypothetical protein [Haloferax mediterranei]AFK19192.1 hypothetical protein HFX_1484 [Haloferax mediterranei ATCC 33500]AHZ21446.1 hypothetical protein BM92_01730 [Haloferax mediterranei ATCC 33500]EMA03905.1 hypothetical protein C439_03068 [Haloferax mediterranei ATCC 33500]MDX5989291.1 hypothetical protein [Haloferax mediterranei ATCC 33500]QCQ75662.1 hypothetical protein E6P09_10445 [Haloferax mediterranei ATCC 33500]
MSDVSLSNLLSFLETDDVATVVERVRAARDGRTKRSKRDGRMFLFAAPAGEQQPTEVIWVDVEAAFDQQTVEAFAERCEGRGIEGTLLTTGDEERARETLAFTFATEEQLEEPGDTPEEPELLVDPEEVDVPITLETLDDLVAALEETDLADEVIDEYHEPHEPEFEDILNEIDEEEAEQAATDAEQESGSGSGLIFVLLVVLVGIAAVALFLFGPF